MTRHARLLLLLLPALVLVVPGCYLGGIVAQKTVTRTLTHVTGRGLDVETQNGAIDARADATVDQVEVDLVVYCGGATRGEAQTRLAGATVDVVRTASGTVRIRTSCPSPDRSNDGADVTVRLPDARGIRLVTSNGRIEAGGLDGALVAHTSNGAIGVIGQAGTSDLTTSNGTIDVRGQAGTLSAHTSNGSITAVLASNAAGPMTLETSNGAIDANVGGAFHGRVDLSTSNGSVTVTDHAGRVTQSHLGAHDGYVVVDGSGPSSRLSTSNGSIRLTITAAD